MLVEHLDAYVRRILEPWGTIIDRASGDCPPDFAQIFEGVRAGGGRLLVELLGFDWGDIARGALRPRGIGGANHLRRGAKGKHVGGIPEIGNEIGKVAGNATEIRGRAVSDGVKKLWVADAMLQRVGFWILVAEATRKTGYAALSAMQSEGFCRAPNDPASQQGFSQWLYEFGPPPFFLHGNTTRPIVSAAIDPGTPWQPTVRGTRDRLLYASCEAVGAMAGGQPAPTNYAATARLTWRRSDGSVSLVREGAALIFQGQSEGPRSPIIGAAQAHSVELEMLPVPGSGAAAWWPQVRGFRCYVRRPS